MKALGGFQGRLPFCSKCIVLELRRSQKQGNRSVKARRHAGNWGHSRLSSIAECFTFKGWGQGHHLQHPRQSARQYGVDIVAFGERLKQYLATP